MLKGSRSRLDDWWRVSKAGSRNCLGDVAVGCEQELGVGSWSEAL